MSLRGPGDPTQQRTRRVQAGAIVFLMLAVAASEGGFVGKAGAIDLPGTFSNALKKKGTPAPKAVPAPRQPVTNVPTGARQVLGNSPGLQRGTSVSGLPKTDRRIQTNTALPKTGNTALQNNPALQRGLNPGSNTAGQNPNLNNRIGANTAPGRGLPGNAGGQNQNLLNNRLGANTAPGRGLIGNTTGQKQNLLNNRFGANTAPGRVLPGNTGPLVNNAVGHSATTRLVNGRMANFQNVHSRIAVSANMVERQRLIADHRRDLMAWRLVMPRRPLPGERGFTGVPPVGETRLISTEIMFRAGPGVSQQAINQAALRNGLTVIASQPNSIAGGTIYHFRITGGRPVGDVVRTLEAQNLGIQSPVYVYQTTQGGDAEVKDAPATELQSSNLQDTNLQDLAARSETGANGQYVVGKLRLGEVHRVATGNNVLIAVIDSKIDVNHPDLAGAIVEQRDFTGNPEPSHSHGTGMAGAIVSHLRILGVAPSARILAATAFSTSTRQTPEATTKSILDAMDWAISKGARIINMSFAGPYDPMLQVAMKNAAAKGVVLVAATGNSGPKSPPLYPAADPNVIGVTATDQNDRQFAQAVRGPHVAIAAPGVDIMVPAPDNTYQLTTGTSVATAHVTGVAALLLERHPNTTAAMVLEVLTSSAKRLSSKGRDDLIGWGLIDPASALADLDARMEVGGAQIANQGRPPVTPQAPQAAPKTAGAPKALPASAPKTTSAFPR